VLACPVSIPTGGLRAEVQATEEPTARRVRGAQGLGHRDRTPTGPDRGRLDVSGTAWITVREHIRRAWRLGMRAGS